MNLTPILSFREAHVYQLKEILGKGKYATVFKATHKLTQQPYVVKLFHPGRTKKLKREILILKSLNQISIHPGYKNTIRYHETISIMNEISSSYCPAIVTDYIENDNDWRSLYSSFTLNDIKYYSYQLLQVSKVPII